MHLEITDIRTLTDETPNVREMEFHDAPISIGSHSANMVQLPDPAVAPYHAMLLPTGGDRWLFQPTVPDLLTIINGEPVRQQVDLGDGDEIEISHFCIKFTVDAVPELELPAPGNVEELAKIRNYPLPSRSQVRKEDAEVGLDAVRQKVLVDYSFALRNCFDFAAVMEQTLSVLMEELGARSAWMGLRRKNEGRLEFVDGRSVEGSQLAEPPRLETYVYRCMSRLQFIRIPRTGDGVTQSVLAVPIVSSRGPIGLIYVDTRRRTRVFDEADLDLVTCMAGMVAPHIEAVIDDQLHHREQIEAGGLSLIQHVQARLDATNSPRWQQLQVAVYAKPGLERAGDVYDIMRLPNGLAAIMLGHLRAAPTRVALAMCDLRSAFRIAGLHADPPHIQLKAWDWLLRDEKYPCELDAAVIIMNPKTGAVEFSTAGTIGVLVVGTEGDLRTLTMPDVPSTGQAKSFDHYAASERLRDGETLVLYTNGCTAVRNAAGDTLGAKRFLETVCDGFGQPASAMLEGLLADLGPFLKDGSPPDDITILLVHRVAAS